MNNKQKKESKEKNRIKFFLEIFLWSMAFGVIGIEVIGIIFAVKFLFKVLPHWMAISFIKNAIKLIGVGVVVFTAWKIFTIIVPRGTIKAFLPFSILWKTAGPGIHLVPLGRIIKSEDVPQKFVELEFVVKALTTREGRYYYQFTELSEYLRASEEEKKKMKPLMESLLREKGELKNEDKEIPLDQLTQKIKMIVEKMKEGTADPEKWKSFYCKATTIPEVRLGIYLYYPETPEQIEKMLDRWRGVPDKKQLEDELSTLVEGSLREIGGRVNWMVLVANRRDIEREFLDTLKEPHSVLVKGGFPVEEITIRLTEVVLPPDLAEMLHLPQIAQLRKEAISTIMEELEARNVDPALSALLAEKQKAVALHFTGSGGGDLEKIIARIGAVWEAVSREMKEERKEEKRETEISKKEEKSWEEEWDEAEKELGLKE